MFAPDLSEEEMLAFKCLFEDRLTASDASAYLQKRGYIMSPAQLRDFKVALSQKISTEERKERLCELALESFERAKYEFEDWLTETKNLFEKVKSEGKVGAQIALLREIRDGLTLALKHQGELHEGLTSIQANNINIISASDLSQRFKNTLEQWFSTMDANYENGKIVFNHPTPELIDDYNRWQARQLQTAEKTDFSTEKADENG